MSRRTRFANPVLRGFLGLVVALITTMALIGPVGAQYGGITGLFVTITPDDPDGGSFTGLGCPSGHEVVLYIEGVPPTANDPVATQDVPGRIIAVTTATTSSNGLLDGTFSFQNIQIPDDLPPGRYVIHSRCGSVDVSVIIEISTDRSITVITTTGDPGNPAGPGSPLAFSGRESSRVVSLAAGIVAAGIGLISLSRRAESV